MSYENESKKIYSEGKSLKSEIAGLDKQIAALKKNINDLKKEKGEANIKEINEQKKNLEKKLNDITKEKKAKKHKLDSILSDLVKLNKKAKKEEKEYIKAKRDTSSATGGISNNDLEARVNMQNASKVAHKKARYYEGIEKTIHGYITELKSNKTSNNSNVHRSMNSANYIPLNTNYESSMNFKDITDIPISKESSNNLINKLFPHPFENYENTGVGKKRQIEAMREQLEMNYYYLNKNKFKPQPVKYYNKTIKNVKYDPMNSYNYNSKNKRYDDGDF